MPESPRTPRRRHSSMDVSFHTDSPEDDISPNQIRRASKSSFQDPLTPLRNSMNESELVLLGGGGGGEGEGEGHDNGLGNLADELADALSGSGEDDEYYEDGEGPSGLQDHDGTDDDGEGDGTGYDGARHHREDVAAAAAAAAEAAASAVAAANRHKAQSSSLSIPPVNGGRGHRRMGSAYDGSEYGSESDLDTPGMPPSLVARIDAVESLARRGTESTGGPADGVFKRLTDGLKDLGSQSVVEGSTTRLITAHSALATHLAHQTRQLHNLTFPLLSPLVAAPDADTIDALAPLLTAVSEAMPRPAAPALDSLAALHAATADLAQALAYLSDTLHMSRQTTATAARRLRTARDMVAEMRREDELRQEGERWLARGGWGDRLRRRECAGVCRDVVGGFEEVCDGWRARLLAQAAEAPPAPPSSTTAAA